VSRPVRHLTPESGFLNDPTGLLRLDDGWHAWYQLSPGATHGDVAWGHAVSDDRVTWRHLPVSIPSDDEEEVWTGSVVVDTDDTAGFGAGALVAAYTRHEKHRRRESQALAVSTDGGLTWTKHGVVLDVGSTDFRDPRVLRQDGRWLMVVARALEDAISLYASPDLHTWTHVSDIAMPPSGGGPWECPDLFPLGDRWVLLVSREPATYSVVGDFDGTRFTPATGVQRLDLGPDLYAGVTFSAPPHGERALMGWLDNWAYAQVLPTEPWRGQLSCVRELSLTVGGDGEPYVAQRPTTAGASVALDLPVELAPGVRASYAEGTVTLTRSPEVVPGWSGTWTLPSPSAAVEVVLDSHSVEVFTVDGRSASLHTLPTG
jgi:sucrose-6-phosphate hydrolase SacC (GH32 family)